MSLSAKIARPLNRFPQETTMPKVEQRARMQSMRGLIQEFNVYRWAGRMLIDAARMRQKERVMQQVRRPSLLS